MKRKYPRISRRFKMRKMHKSNTCYICKDARCEGQTEVQFNIFRGDDGCYAVHKHCIQGKSSTELIAAIFQVEQMR